MFNVQSLNEKPQYKLLISDNFKMNNAFEHLLSEVTCVVNHSLKSNHEEAPLLIMSKSHTIIFHNHGFKSGNYDNRGH